MADYEYLQHLENGDLVAVRNAAALRVRAMGISVPEIEQGALLLSAIKIEIERRKREVPSVDYPGNPNRLE